MKRLLELCLSLFVISLTGSVDVSGSDKHDYSSEDSYNLLSSDDRSSDVTPIPLSSSSESMNKGNEDSSSLLSEGMNSNTEEESVLSRALSHVIHRTGHGIIPVVGSSKLASTIRHLMKSEVPEIVADECTHALSLSTLQRELSEQGIDLKDQIVEVPRVGDDIFLAVDNVCIYLEP